MATTTVQPKSVKMDKLHELQLLHVCQEMWSAKLWLTEGIKNTFLGASFLGADTGLVIDSQKKTFGIADAKFKLFRQKASNV